MSGSNSGIENVSMHEKFMREALKEARKAYKKGEVPIGAVVVQAGRVIGRGHNVKEMKCDATLHAEIQALRKAYKKAGTWRLNDCSMYVTLEPCPMCAGAIIQSRIGELYFGTYDPKAGAAGSVVNLLEEKAFNHQVIYTQGILENACADILRAFFRELRAGSSLKKKRSDHSDSEEQGGLNNDRGI